MNWIKKAIQRIIKVTTVNPSNVRIFMDHLKRNYKKILIYLKELNQRRIFILMKEYQRITIHAYYISIGFFCKIINRNSEEIDFSKLSHIWRKSTMDIYGFIFPDHCKFQAKRFHDIKIMKVLRDHIFYSNRTQNTNNLIK